MKRREFVALVGSTAELVAVGGVRASIKSDPSEWRQTWVSPTLLSRADEVIE